MASVNCKVQCGLYRDWIRAVMDLGTGRASYNLQERHTRTYCMYRPQRQPTPIDPTHALHLLR